MEGQHLLLSVSVKDFDAVAGARMSDGTLSSKVNQCINREYGLKVSDSPKTSSSRLVDADVIVVVAVVAF